jgi:hypothetical protein
MICCRISCALLRFLLHSCEVASSNKMGMIVVRVRRLGFPAIPVRDRPTTENIGNDAANCREIFGAVEGPPSGTNEILKLWVPGNDRILGFGDAIPKKSLSSRYAPN